MPRVISACIAVPTGAQVTIRPDWSGGGAEAGAAVQGAAGALG